MKTRLRSVRFRATAGASLTVAIALLVVGVGLLLVLRSGMTSNIDKELELRAMNVARAIDGGTPPRLVATTAGEDSFTQVFADDGRLLGATTNVSDLGAPLAPGPGHHTITDRRIDNDPVRVFEVTTTSAAPVTVVVGASLSDMQDTLHLVVLALAVGFPLLLLVVALTTWAVVGRALQPVEAITVEVASIEATDLHRRVPEPGSRDEIDRLARTMNEMLDRLEEADARQRAFVSDASHELRTPIAAIRHQLEVALSHPDSARLADLATDVLVEDLRMQQLVDDLLWLAVYDNQGRLSVTRLVDLDDLVRDEAQRCLPRLRVDTRRVGAGQTRGEPDELRRVFTNLLDNAARFARSRVEVSVATNEDMVVVQVEDDGPGVPERDRSLIFERFVRGDSSRTRAGGGAGLGLAIAHDIVVRHGGTIEVSPGPDLGGARFTVALPDARAVNQQALEPSVGATHSSADI